MWKGLNHEQVMKYILINKYLHTLSSFSSLSLLCMYMYIVCVFVCSLLLPLISLSLYLSCYLSILTLSLSPQVQQLMQCIYGRSAVSVDWRRLVLCLSQPYPLPSAQDLLTTLSSIRAALNGRNSKMITREDYMSTSIWLDERADEDRDTRLKSVSTCRYLLIAYMYMYMYVHVHVHVSLCLVFYIHKFNSIIAPPPIHIEAIRHFLRINSVYIIVQLSFVFYMYLSLCMLNYMYMYFVSSFLSFSRTIRQIPWTT